MATQKPTTKAAPEKTAPASTLQVKAHNERLRAAYATAAIAAIVTTGTGDILAQTESVRALAKKLNLPYVVVLVAAETGMDDPHLTDEDIFDYLDWCAEHNIAAGQPIDEEG